LIQEVLVCALAILMVGRIKTSRLVFPGHVYWLGSSTWLT
jgi:hypothetical protein